MSAFDYVSRFLFNADGGPSRLGMLALAFLVALLIWPTVSRYVVALSRLGTAARRGIEDEQASRARVEQQLDRIAELVAERQRRRRSHG